MNYNWKDNVRNRFGAQAGTYDDHSEIQKFAASCLSEHLTDDQNKLNILEIGCGTGILSNHLIQKYPDADFHFTDISQDMLTIAQDNISQPLNTKQSVRWEIMDGEKINESSRYDLIISNMVFQWFENPLLSIENLGQALSPNGQIYYTVPSKNTFPEWIETTQEHFPGQIIKPRAETWPGLFSTQRKTIDYGSTFNFLKTLKKTGANTPFNPSSNWNASDLRRACKITDNEHKGHITWEILFGRL